MIAAFVTGLGLGAVVAAQVGPVSLLCIRTGLRFGFRPAVGAGAALVDALYGAAALIGLGGALRYGPARLVFGLIGAAVLMVMGARTLWTAHRVRLGLETESEVVTPAAALRTALAATASNPLTIVFGRHHLCRGRRAARRRGDRKPHLVRHPVARRGDRRRTHPNRSLYAVDVAAGTGLVGSGALLGLRTMRDA